MRLKGRGRKVRRILPAEQPPVALHFGQTRCRPQCLAQATYTQGSPEQPGNRQNSGFFPSFSSLHSEDLQTGSGQAIDGGNRLKEEMMNLQDLARYDGRDGRKAYVAVSGSIYDVTGSPLWSHGDHQGEHQAGRDLTEELRTAPHVRMVIDRFPIVDQLTADEPAAGGAGKWLLAGALLLVAVIAGALLI